MAKKPTTPRLGRASIFRDKSERVQGILSKHAKACFEQSRRDLKALHREVLGRDPVVVSDSDVIEYLARGRDDTEVYLEKAR